MEPEIYEISKFLIVALPIFLFGAGTIALCVLTPMERIFERIDAKVAAEIQRRCRIDGIEGEEIDCLNPNLTLIRRNCKRESRVLFAYVFVVSLVSEICGYVFVVRGV